MRSQKDFPETGVATSELSIRCVEFHTYTAGGGLMSLVHRDRGSVLTISVLLSSPAACEGGEFITWTRDGTRDGTEKVHHGMQRGDGIFFHSEKTHNVEMVTSGRRHSLVIELWRSCRATGREAEITA
jgi:predicted 2-oxoglutarate/Fe(II)-dependent dioxygenase YbiX